MCIIFLRSANRAREELLTVMFSPSDESGWWTGKTTGGLDGFFPGTYVEKI